VTGRFRELQSAFKIGLAFRMLLVLLMFSSTLNHLQAKTAFVDVVAEPQEQDVRGDHGHVLPIISLHSPPADNTLCSPTASDAIGEAYSTGKDNEIGSADTTEDLELDELSNRFYNLLLCIP
jgi:hypothetical protein